MEASEFDAGEKLARGHVAGKRHAFGNMEVGRFFIDLAKTRRKPRPIQRRLGAFRRSGPAHITRSSRALRSSQEIRDRYKTHLNLIPKRAGREVMSRAARLRQAITELQHGTERLKGRAML
jgi:hypothetical protein